MYELTGKVALVTGAGGESGLGRAIACRLAREGANVAISDLNKNCSGSWLGLTAVADEIEALGRDALCITGDVSDSDRVDEMVSATLERYGKIDIVVNNAGAPAGPDRVPVVDLEEDVFDRVMQVNVKGTFLMCRAVARHMLKRGGGGNIVNMSSLAGTRGKKEYAAYCASKAAIISFTQSLACELGEHGIRVNAICPGLIDNERVYGMASSLRPDGVSIEDFHDVLIERVSQSNPLRRPGTPGDVADIAAWLVSDQAKYITAQAIKVTGGDEFKQ